MYDVITVGSATVDLFIHTDPEETKLLTVKTKNKNNKILGFPLGEKILIDKVTFETGGGGTNTAVSLSRLGLKTAFLGKVGEDDNGKKVIGDLVKEDVEFIGEISKEQTGFSVVLDSIKEDRTIFTFKGANDSLKMSDFEKSRLAASWFYFSSMTEQAYKTLEELAAYAKSNKIKIIFNPSSYLVKKGYPFLKKVIDNCEILVMNKEESETLSKKTGIDKSLKELHKQVPIIVITDGKNGAFAYDGSVKYSIAARKIDVVETTGAGDAFASAFLAGMIKKRNIEFSLQLGLSNSQSVIQYIGAKNKLLTFSQAIEIMRENPVEVKKSKL
jgi:ribokinase